MNLQALQLHLKKNKKDSLFIISGEDLYLIAEAKNLIKNSLTTQNIKLDIQTYTAPQMDYDKCLDSLQNLSILSPLKLIHIKALDKAKPEFLESINQFYSQENLHGLTVLLGFTKIDKRKKNIQFLLKKGVLVEAKPPYDNQIEGWIKYIAGKKQLNLKNEAVSYLNFLVGPCLVEISNNIQKLKDLFGQNPVGREDIQSFISKRSEGDLFKICDLLGKHEVTQAMSSLEYAIKHGASSAHALSLFHRHFKIIDGVLKEQQKSREMRKSLSEKHMAVALGVPPYFLANYVNQARKWSLNKISEVFKALEAADTLLKSTGLNESTIFTGFFIEILRIIGEQKGLRSLSEALR